MGTEISRRIQDESVVQFTQSEIDAVSGTVTAAEVQAVYEKVNELIAALDGRGDAPITGS